MMAMAICSPSVSDVLDCNCDLLEADLLEADRVKSARIRLLYPFGGGYVANCAIVLGGEHLLSTPNLKR